jgi:hypothetical protein
MSLIEKDAEPRRHALRINFLPHVFAGNYAGSRQAYEDARPRVALGNAAEPRKLAI